MMTRMIYRTMGPSTPSPTHVRNWNLFSPKSEFKFQKRERKKRKVKIPPLNLPLR